MRNLYKCDYCGAPTRPNVDGDIRYDAMKPLRTIERLENENKELRARVAELEDVHIDTTI